MLSSHAAIEMELTTSSQILPLLPIFPDKNKSFRQKMVSLNREALLKSRTVRATTIKLSLIKNESFFGRHTVHVVKSPEPIRPVSIKIRRINRIKRRERIWSRTGGTANHPSCQAPQKSADERSAKKEKPLVSRGMSSKDIHNVQPPFRFCLYYILCIILPSEWAVPDFRISLPISVFHKCNTKNANSSV